MTETKIDAMENACAHLNNVDLPNVGEILRSLAQVVSAARIDPYLQHDSRITRAQNILQAYEMN